MSNDRRASFQFRRRDSMSPDRRTSMSNYSYLRESGEARLVFVKTSEQFEGVFINKNDDIFALHGILTEENGDDGKTNFKCTLNVYDEETGSEYVIKDISITTMSDDDSDNNNAILYNTKDLLGNNDQSSDLDSSDLDGSSVDTDAALTPPPQLQSIRVSLNNEPCLSCPFDHKPIVMHSQSVHFATGEILMGARADQEIVRCMNSNLVGQNLCVYSGRMQINTCKSVAPHKGFTARRMSKEFFEEIDAIKANDFLL